MENTVNLGYFYHQSFSFKNKLHQILFSVLE